MNDIQYNVVCDDSAYNLVLVVLDGPFDADLFIVGIVTIG